MHRNSITMKRRKRKRKAKPGANPAEQVIVQRESEETASRVEVIAIEVEIEEAAAPVQISDEAETLGNPVAIAADTEKLAPESAATSGADRRAHPRYAFTGTIEVVAAALGARLKTRVRDLSQQGCYVDTDSPLDLGTAADVRITKGAQAFAARARVVYKQTGKGMGLMFTAVEEEQRRILEAWIEESRETSWLAANRRRSQRVLMKIPVRVSGRDSAGALIEEEANTVAVSVHGALILLAAPVKRGQRFTLSNVQTNSALECVVVHIGKTPDAQTQVGVEFLLPNPTFWRVAFPPKDWTPRHPDAKFR